MKLALVTGGNKRIGGHISAALARAGYALAIHTHSSSELEDHLAQALADTGAPWHRLRADLADPRAPDKLWSQLLDHFGVAPTLVVNNASRFVWDDPASVTPQALTEHYAINCAAPALLARRLAETASPTEPAMIVNILDQQVANPNGDHLSYTLSKLALAGLTTVLARALAPHVRVNGVAPGLTLASPDFRPGQIEALAAVMPLARLPAPEQIAQAVVYLAQAEAVTGQILYVDAGAHLRSYERDFAFMHPDRA